MDISDELLNKLSVETGLTDLRFNEEGVASFIFDEVHQTCLEKHPDTHTLILWGKVGTLPFANREACLIHLLQGNLFGKETGKASLGLEPMQEEIYLFQTFDLDTVTFELFFEELKRFLKTQKSWAEKVKNAFSSGDVSQKVWG